MGKVIAKLFNRPEKKSKQVRGESRYKYQKLMYVDEATRDSFDRKVKFAEHMSIVVDNEIITINIPTVWFLDGQLEEHKVFYHLENAQYFMQTRGRNWDMAELIVGQFSDFDQMFVNSIMRMTDGVIICLGRNVRIPAGKKDSTNLVQVAVGKLTPGSVTPVEKMHWFSINCKRVLPFTCKGNNTTCAQCVHDINQHIRNLRDCGILRSGSC